MIGSTTARALIGNTTRTLVYQSIRRDPRVGALRTAWPAANRPMLSVWQPYLIQVRAMATDRIDRWIRSWLTEWRSAAASRQAAQQHSQPHPNAVPETSGSPATEPADSKHLSPAQLLDMMGRSSEYVSHRTPKTAPGTCKVALEPELEQDKMKNPMQERGIWAAIGLEGLPGYGDYRVIFPRTARWLHRDLPAVIYPEHWGSLPPDQAIGWFHEDDWQKALASRKK